MNTKITKQLGWFAAVAILCMYAATASAGKFSSGRLSPKDKMQLDHWQKTHACHKACEKHKGPDYESCYFECMQNSEG